MWSKIWGDNIKRLPLYKFISTNLFRPFDVHGSATDDLSLDILELPTKHKNSLEQPFTVWHAMRKSNLKARLSFHWPVCRAIPGRSSRRGEGTVTTTTTTPGRSSTAVGRSLCVPWTSFCTPHTIVLKCKKLKRCWKVGIPTFYPYEYFLIFLLTFFCTNLHSKQQISTLKKFSFVLKVALSFEEVT